MWLGARAMLPELMDDAALDEVRFAAALRDLERINRISFAYRPTLAFLEKVRARTGATALSILDVGAGGGDMLRRIAAWGARRGVMLDLVGLDRSPWAAPFARAAGTPGRWITADLFDLPETERFDLVISALFAHHLPDADLVRFLRWMDGRARLGWMVNDIHRHPVSWLGVWAGTRLMRMDPVTAHDGTASVARAFARADWQRLLAEAGLAAEISWAFPFRWAVSAIRPAP
jgi:2-polyprenyl-3-methyl-5-hydroxy-6-metoxy-1,4-benzoquinol methylase